jgi:DNA-3-methyladenine glycosylase
MKELGNDFFCRDTVLVARDLAGKILRVDDTYARIVEVEAYKTDKASHAFKRTPRSELMYSTHAHIYVYIIYGMYNCLNITTDTLPGAILIRAVDYPGCNGPGKLCRTLKITRKDNGAALGGRFRVYEDGKKFKVRRSTRIGITKDTHLKWRFYIKD